MATLPLSNVESLSYQRVFNFLGEIFCYNSTDVYTISSRVRNTGSNPEYSIDPVWDNISDTMSNSLNYYDFTIDGVQLGSGRITSFKWEPGTDVLSKPYTMSIEIQSTGNLYNFTGASYNDINLASFVSGLTYVSNLQESIDLSWSQNHLQELNQSLSFDIGKPLSASQKLNLKNSLYSGFYVNRIPNVGMNTYAMSIISGQTSGYISYFNETIDTINSRYGFQRRSFYDNVSQKASWTYSHNVQLNGNNSVVIENGSVQSVYFKGTSGFRNLSGARDRWADISTGIFNRVSGTFAALSGFSGLYPSGYRHSLLPYPIDKRIQENPLAGTIDYAFTFSNDPIYNSSGYTFSNNRNSNVDEDGYYIITENGEYRGVSINQAARFVNAYNGYSYNEDLILNRVSGTFLLASTLNSFLCQPTGSFKITQDSVTYQEYDGIISYSKIYSNNPSYYPTGSNFIKYTNVITDRPPVHYYNKFLIPRSSEYVQSAAQSTEGSWSNNITIVGKRGVSIDDYLNEAFTKVVKPTGINILDYFLRNMSYSFNPFNNTFSSSFEYYYSKYKQPGDVLV
jgi:hypothetical protein